MLNGSWSCTENCIWHCWGNHLLSMCRSKDSPCQGNLQIRSFKMLQLMGAALNTEVTQSLLGREPLFLLLGCPTCSSVGAHSALGAPTYKGNNNQYYWEKEVLSWIDSRGRNDNNSLVGAKPEQPTAMVIQRCYPGKSVCTQADLLHQLPGSCF